MLRSWNETKVDRLAERVDRLERQLREEKQRSSERWTRVLFLILWLEIAAIWAFSIVRAAGL